jgi:hypothetical protein
VKEASDHLQLQGCVSNLLVSNTSVSDLSTSFRVV